MRKVEDVRTLERSPDASRLLGQQNDMEDVAGGDDARGYWVSRADGRDDYDLPVNAGESAFERFNGSQSTGGYT